MSGYGTGEGEEALTPSLKFVRFAPKSGQTGEVSICPLCAKSGHMQRSKKGRGEED